MDYLDRLYNCVCNTYVYMPLQNVVRYIRHLYKKYHSFVVINYYWACEQDIVDVIFHTKVIYSAL